MRVLRDQSIRGTLVAAVFLWAFPAQANEPTFPQGWPLQSEIPSADGEDEPLEGQFPHYFSFGDASFLAIPAAAGPPKARRIERFLGDGGETETMDCPKGIEWDLGQTWASGDGRWVFWRGSRGDKPILQVVSAGSLSESFELPSNNATSIMEVSADTPAAVIHDNRLYLLGQLQLPEDFRTSFPPDAGLFPHETAWADLAWPEDTAKLRGARERLSGSLDSEPLDSDSRKASEEVQALLAMPRRPIVGDEVVGDWKVRSIQGSHGAHYAYPFFKARIENLDGVFFFEKISGSQRRSGLLHRNLQDEWIFLGGRTTNEDPQVSYSGRSASQLPSDSIGVFHQLGKDHLLMILDVSWEGDYEIYELIRR